jgi:hypothetical protein
MLVQPEIFTHSYSGCSARAHSCHTLIPSRPGLLRLLEFSIKLHFPIRIFHHGFILPQEVFHFLTC